MSNLGPNYYLKTSAKPAFKSNFKSKQKFNNDYKYDPKKDRHNVAFHKARKEAMEDSTLDSPNVRSADDNIDKNIKNTPEIEMIVIFVKLDSLL